MTENFPWVPVLLILGSLTYYAIHVQRKRKAGLPAGEAVRQVVREESVARSSDPQRTRSGHIDADARRAHREAERARRHALRDSMPSARERADAAKTIRAENPGMSTSEAIREEKRRRESHTV